MAQRLAPTKKPLLGERWHREAMTERGLIAKHNDSSPLSVAYGDSRPRAPSLALRAIHLVPPRGASHLPIIFSSSKGVLIYGRNQSGNFETHSGNQR